MQKSVLITGASSGIGEALARAYAKAGWKLVLVARREERLKALATELGNTEILALDVSSSEFGTKLSQFLATYGGLDLVYANAGIGCSGSFAKLSDADYERHFATNIMGVIKTAHASLAALQSRKGRLVIIGSMNSYMALPLGSTYSMGKFAVRGLAESLYCEGPILGIQCSIVCPGPVHTEILAVSNSGERVPPVKFRQALSADEAARRIQRQVACGRREIFLRSSERMLIALHRHFPCLTLRVMRFVFVRFYPRFRDLVAKLNPNAV